MPAVTSLPTMVMTRGPCSTTSGTRISNTRSDTPRWRRTGFEIFGAKAYFYGQLPKKQHTSCSDQAGGQRDQQRQSENGKERCDVPHVMHASESATQRDAGCVLQRTSAA